MRHIHIFAIAATLISTFGISFGRPARRPKPSEVELQNIRHGRPRTVEVVAYQANYKDGKWVIDTGWLSPLTRTVTRWNSEGHPLTDTSYTILGQQVISSSFTRYFYYSDEYRKAFILSTSYSGDSLRQSTTYRLEFGYDHQGRLKNTWLRDSAGMKIHTTLYRIDRKGCVRSDRTFDAQDRLISSTRQRCDARGGILWMKNSLYPMGEKRSKPMVSVYRNSYEDGLLQRTILVRTRGGHTSQRGETARYIYEYDEHGTWLRRIAWTEDAPEKAQIQERRIEYYE